ncbi:MAG TPA: hypothetical protein VNL16_18815 [Chloroflexota bacterium]|nr:hypothetical protein [Chloroflexota bacterium]
MGDGRNGATVLVVSDDAELGGLVALNLRRRGFLVEHTDLALAQAARWAPALGQPDLLVVVVENAERASPVHLRRLLERPWAQSVPFILAAERPALITRALSRPPALSFARPADVGGIVVAARTLLDEATVR